MRFQKCPACYRTALLVFTTSLAAAQTSRPEVPYVPTTEEAVQAMLKLADVKKTDVVYDLGCGDGRIVIAAAKTYGAHGVGIDINPQRIHEAKENAKKAGVEDLVRFEENDLFKADIHEASVVTLFLLQTVNLRLRPKLLRELKPGSFPTRSTWATGSPTKKRPSMARTLTSALALAVGSSFGLFPKGTKNSGGVDATRACLDEGPELNKNVLNRLRGL